VVRNIVLAHGGQITFESKLGSGTTFKVSLPLNSGSLSSVGSFEAIGPIKIEKQTR
jgi:signal transduction histidine kinase